MCLSVDVPLLREPPNRILPYVFSKRLLEDVQNPALPPTEPGKSILRCIAGSGPALVGEAGFLSYSCTPTTLLSKSI
jgi:hypothetical protein